MINTLKNMLSESNEEVIITFIKDNPDVLSEEDEQGVTGIFLIAYYGFHRILKLALEIKDRLSFHEAVAFGGAEYVNKVIDANFEAARLFSKDGFPPIALAAFFNQTEIAKYLISKGADPAVTSNNSSKVNALHAAIARENLELSSLFLKEGVDPNIPQSKGVRPLHSAAHKGNLDLVKLLVENGANVHLKMDSGETALSLAIKDGHTEVVEYLQKVN
jgi:uncharacterized protein